LGSPERQCRALLKEATTREGSFPVTPDGAVPQGATAKAASRGTIRVGARGRCPRALTCIRRMVARFTRRFLRAQAAVRWGLRSGGDLCEGKAEELAEGKLGGQGRERCRADGGNVSVRCRLQEAVIRLRVETRVDSKRVLRLPAA